MAIEVRPASPATGAEILGADIGAGLDGDEFAIVREALDRHGVIVLRNQTLTPEQQVAFTRQFGEPEFNFNAARFGIDGSPEIYLISNIVEYGAPIGTRRAGETWHTDMSYAERPAGATMLYAVEVPVLHGLTLGDTCFANAAAAYEALQEETRERVKGLDALFVYGTDQRNKSLVVAARTLDSEQRAVHPVVNAHAATGRAGIYANPLLTVGVVGMEQEESDRLLDELYDMLDRPEFHWEHEWSVGDTLMWDNRGGVMHCGRLDYPRNELRRFLRTTVTGGPILPA